jgi:hypothetical protein
MTMRLNFRMKSLMRSAACVALSLGAPCAFGASAEPAKAQAQLLDHAELLCDNCFFGPSDYYYCFAADDKILIGYQRTRVLNWRDESKNYLTKLHHKWVPWTAPGQTVPIAYDAKHIWVTREDGKQVRLTQDYSMDIFMSDDRCRNAVKAKGH